MKGATTPVAPGFAWGDTETGFSLRCEPLNAHATHLFTTRQLQLRGETETDDVHRLAVAVGAREIVRVRQVHGCVVVVVRPGEPVGELPEADAIVSLDATRGIAVRIADCVPILLADTAGPLVAAVHAGWRGTCAGVATATIRAIADLGVPPARLVAAIGPSIGACCYQVDDRVRDAFLQMSPVAERWFAADGTARWRLDLWAANRDQLSRVGVPPSAIHVARMCTSHLPAYFFSFRRDGAGTGRLAAAIRTRHVGGVDAT